MIKLPKFQATTSLISVASEKLEAYAESLKQDHEIKAGLIKAERRAEAELEADEIRDNIMDLHSKRKTYTDEQLAIINAYMS